MFSWNDADKEYYYEKAQKFFDETIPEEKEG